MPENGVYAMYRNEECYLDVWIVVFQVVPMLPEASVRCDARARTNQNNWLGMIFGQVESGCTANMTKTDKYTNR